MSSSQILIRRQPPLDKLGPEVRQEMLLDLVGLTVPAEEANGGYRVTAEAIVAALVKQRRNADPWQGLAKGFTRHLTLPGACCERIGG